MIILTLLVSGLLLWVVEYTRPPARRGHDMIDPSPAKPRPAREGPIVVQDFPD